MKEFRFLFAQNSINALSAIYLLEYLIFHILTYEFKTLQIHPQQRFINMADIHCTG